VLATDVSLDPLAPVALVGYINQVAKEAIHRRWLSEGDTALEHLNGAFVAALHNKESSVTEVIRDVVGQRALFVLSQGTRTTFATELTTLLRIVPCSPAPDDETIAAYLAMSTRTREMTFFRGVERLPPGHKLVLRKGQKGAIVRYWTPHYHGTLTDPAPRIGRLLEAAVKTSVRDDIAEMTSGRVGVLLSGGIDSGSVAAAAAAHSDGSVLRGAIEYTRRWSVPDPSANTYFWSQLLEAARDEGVTRLLDGEGGDERFAPAYPAIGDAIATRDLGLAMSLARNIPGGRSEPSRVVLGVSRGTRARFSPHWLEDLLLRRALYQREYLTSHARRCAF
jgi:asparagine synthetase B (glutamine-hydrolysing)